MLADPDGLAAKLPRDVGLDHLRREGVGGEPRGRIGMDAEKAPVSRLAEEGLVPVNGAGGEAGPETPARSDAEQPLHLDPHGHAADLDYETARLAPEGYVARVGGCLAGQHVTRGVVVGEDAVLAAVQFHGQLMRVLVDRAGRSLVGGQYRRMIALDQVAKVGDRRVHGPGQVRGCTVKRAFVIVRLSLGEQRVEAELIGVGIVRRSLHGITRSDR